MRKRDLVDGVVGPRTRETVDSLLCMKGMTTAEKVDFLMSRNRELRAENHHMQDENAKLRELAKLAVHSACFGCPHNDKNSWRSCEGCNLYEMSTESGIEVEA